MEESSTQSPISKFLSAIFYILLFSGIAFGGLIYKKEIRFVLKEDLWKISPCSFTITYSLGTFDTQFGVSREEFLTDIEKSTSLWDKALNRTFFKYQETGGDITVNLIYDKRQKTTDKLEEVSSTIQAGKNEYDAIKAKYDVAKAEYEKDVAILNTRAKEYKVKVDTYNANVLYWKSRGGAPKAEYDQLVTDKSNLDTEAEELKTLQSDINATLPALNGLVDDMNEVIARYNLSIKTYNTVGSAVGKEFDEGEYEQSLGKKSISIYQFDNDNKLIRVLAHEFGHALGLDHVPDDTDAIMYYLNESTRESLTKSDIDALKAVCKIN